MTRYPVDKREAKGEETGVEERKGAVEMWRVTVQEAHIRRYLQIAGSVHCFVVTHACTHTHTHTHTQGSTLQKVKKSLGTVKDSVVKFAKNE